MLVQERLAEHDRIVRQNGESIIAEPAIALDAITKQRATFTRSDVGRWLHARTLDAEQFNRALSAVMSHDDVVALGVRDNHGNERFTTEAMQSMERAMVDDALALCTSRTPPSTALNASVAVILVMVPQLPEGATEAQFPPSGAPSDLGAVPATPPSGPPQAPSGGRQTRLAHANAHADMNCPPLRAGGLLCPTIGARPSVPEPRQQLPKGSLWPLQRHL